MNKSSIIVLSLSLMTYSTYVLSEVKSNNFLNVNQNPEASEDLVDLHQALSDYSKLDQKNNAIYLISLCSQHNNWDIDIIHP